MKEFLMEKWNTLSGEERMKLKKIASAVLVFLLISIYYYTTDHKSVDNKEEKVETIELEKDLLEQDLHSVVDSQIKSVQNNISAQDKKIDAIKSLVESIASQQAQKNNKSLEDDENKAVHLYPTPPESMPPGSTPATNYPAANAVPQEAVPEEIVGGIERVEGTKVSQEGNVKKKKQLIFLPPSFMPAKLLTGIDAMTSELGQGNPETIILRVQAPAVLPNSLKTNLKGCFVVANAFGNLAKERVQVRLVSLHCMAINGKAVIDQNIKGFVADNDGKRDMSGIVITKAGSNLARSFMAGLSGGFGEAVAQSNNTTYFNPMGATRVVNSEQALRAGVGGGLRSASKDLQQYYLDLAKQAAPVIEVGAAKDVTVVIQEGVTLEIKDFNHDETI